MMLVSVLARVTAAPGTSEPAGSVTVPWTLLVNCANAEEFVKQNSAASNIAGKHFQILIEFITSSLQVSR
jgi:hypothetical protein